MSRALELGSQTAGGLFYGAYDSAVPKKFAFTPEKLTRFYALAKADALREAAASFGEDAETCGCIDTLRRMAKELEKQA